MSKMTLGQVVRAKRNERGLSQVALASEAHVSVSTIVRLEADSFDPRLDSLKRIAVALDSSVGDLLRASA